MRQFVLAAAILAGALHSAPALAQDASLPKVGAAMNRLATQAFGGMTTGDRATSKPSFEKSAVGGLMTSDLIGAAVNNNGGTTIGKIEDLVIADGKAVTGVVVSVGGFLGIGERYVLLNPSSFAVSRKDGTVKAYLDATKDQLEKAPPFTYKKRS